MGRGRFITLEGGEGAGKSTQLRLLAASLASRGLPVVTTREPGGSAAAEEIRALLVTGAPGRWQPLTEALLHTAARHEHVAATVEPALARGDWVVCDRFTDSTMAYQGHGLGLDPGMLHGLAGLATGGLVPDLTLVLDIDPEQGLARSARRSGPEDRYERMDLDFHRRLRAGFREISAADPGRCAVIDADRTTAEVQADILRIVETRLGPLP